MSKIKQIDKGRAIECEEISGEEFRFIRKSAHLTQAEVGERFNRHRSYVCRLETLENIDLFFVLKLFDMIEEPILLNARKKFADGMRIKRRKFSKKNKSKLSAALICTSNRRPFGKLNNSNLSKK